MDLSYVSQSDFSQIPKDKLVTMCRITPISGSVYYDKKRDYYYTDELARYYTPDIQFKYCKSNRDQKFFRNCLACGINRFTDDAWNKSKYAPGRPGDGELTTFCRSKECRDKWLKHQWYCSDSVYYGDIC